MNTSPFASKTVTVLSSGGGDGNNTANTVNAETETIPFKKQVLQ